MNKTQIFEHVSASVDYSVFDVKWVPNTAKFLAIGSKPNGSGVIEVFEMNENKVDSVIKLDRPKALKCCSFGVSELGRSKVAVGDFVGGLHVMYENHKFKEAASVFNESLLLLQRLGVPGETHVLRTRCSQRHNKQPRCVRWHSHELRGSRNRNRKPGRKCKSVGCSAGSGSSCEYFTQIRSGKGNRVQGLLGSDFWELVQ